MLLLKDSTGVNWYEELPDNPANPGRGLGGMSPLDFINLVLSESRIKCSKSLRVIVLYYRFLASWGKHTFAFRYVMQLLRLRIMNTSNVISSETLPLPSYHFRITRFSLGLFVIHEIHFLASVEKISHKV